VSIRLRVPESPNGLVHVAPAPLVEAVLSLHVLMHPKEHPLQHPWIRRMRKLSPALKREIRAFSFLYSDITADFMLPERADTPQDFEAALAAFASMPPERAQYELARPAFFYFEKHGGPDSLAREEVRDLIRRRVSHFSPGGEEIAELILADPATAQRRVVDMLATYWAESFAAEWERLEPTLAEEAARGQQEDPIALLASIRSELQVDAAERLLIRPSGHEHEVTVDAANPLRLIPSVYVWPHVRINCDAPWPLAILYPPRTMQGGPARGVAPEPLVRTLRAAADPTRLRILRLVGERPRSTEELAPLVGLSESGLSKHLRALTDAGLLSTRRQGWYVLYELRRERLEQLGPDLLDYLG
jgi:DNA-binding transcriptional ArsR family regulator